MLQSKLNEISSESELKTNDKFAIELELERVKRDLARVEDELDNRGREAEMNEANLVRLSFSLLPIVSDAPVE